MQNRSRRLSDLRGKLMALHELQRREDIAVFLGSGPMVKGTVYTLRRKCSKPSCRCVGGRRHESLVLTASVSGRTRLWTIPENNAEEMRELTERYRQFRLARARLVKSHVEMLCLIDAIEKLRTNPNKVGAWKG